MSDLVSEPRGYRVEPFSSMGPARSRRSATPSYTSGFQCVNLRQPMGSRLGIVVQRDSGFLRVFARGATVNMLIPLGVNTQESFEQVVAFKVSARIAGGEEFSGFFRDALPDGAAKILAGGSLIRPVASGCGMERVSLVTFKLRYLRTDFAHESVSISDARMLTMTRFQNRSSDWETPNAPYRSRYAPYVSGAYPNDPVRNVCAEQFEARKLCTLTRTQDRAMVSCAPNYLNVVDAMYGDLLGARLFDPERSRAIVDVQTFQAE